MDLESSILTLSLANSLPLILQGLSVGVAKKSQQNVLIRLQGKCVGNTGLLAGNNQTKLDETNNNI